MIDVAETTLPLTDRAMIAVIAEHEPIAATVERFAELAGINRASVCRSLGRLLRAGKIQRQPTNRKARTDPFWEYKLTTRRGFRFLGRYPIPAGTPLALTVGKI